MPIYDRICQDCKAVAVDCLELVRERDKVVTCACGGPMLRGFTQRANAVIGDDIPGGVLIAHGLCHEDGSPQRFYTKSAMRQEAARRGLSNHVEHKPDNRGTDHSKHTSRWV